MPGTRGVLCAIIVALCACSLHAQVISTYAGGAVLDQQPATSTPLNLPRGVAIDRSGNLYIAESAIGLIRKVDAATGIATIIAGGGTRLDDAVPIPGREALLDGPSFPAVDGLGNVYFCDTNNHRVRRITPDGMISTVTGTGTAGFSGDGGPATRAQLNSPDGLYVDAGGSLLISDTENGRVRLVDAATGIIQTIIGGGTGGEGARALELGLRTPRGIAVDAQGNIFVVGFYAGRSRILRVDRATSTATTVAGGGGIHSCAGFDSSVPTDPKTIDLGGTVSVAADQAGAVYYDNCGSIFRINPTDGLVKRYLGAGGNSGDNPVSERAGMVYLTHRSGLVYRAEAENRATTVAGTTAAFDGLLATAVPLGSPLRVAVDRAGNLFISDASHLRVRRVDGRTSVITTIHPNTGSSGEALHVDGNGNVIFMSNAGLQRFDAATGQLTVLIPRASPRLEDGILASEARVQFMNSITSDAAGNIYFTAPRPNSASQIWMLEASTARIRLVAGSGNQLPAGDGGPARDAGLFAFDIAMDGSGNLIIADLSRNRLRQVNLATGIITSLPVDLDGGPFGLAIDSRGTIYVSVGHRVGAVVGGRFVPIAGTGQRGFLGDGGIPTLARLSSPQGLAVDAEGSVYIADYSNGRVRKITALSIAPVLAVRPTAVTFTARQGQAAPSPQSITITGGNLVPLSWTAEVATQSGGNWLAISPSSGAAPTTMVVTGNPANLAPGTYNGSITIISQGAQGSPQTIPVTLIVQSSNPPSIGLSQQFLTFTVLEGGSDPPAQSLQLTNTGGGTLAFSVTTITSGGGNWLQVASSATTAPATLTVRALAAGLRAGLYQALITVRETTTGEQRTIAVTLQVSRAVPVLQVSQTGLLFQGVEGGLQLRPQTLLIQNRGQGLMNWRVQSTAVGSGGDWLRVTPDRGSSDAANPAASPSITVTVDPTRLRAGTHSGLLTITADGAPNSPFVVLVLVNMQPSGTEPTGLLQPAGLIFTAPAGSTAPLTQEITVATTGGRQLQFIAGVRTQSGGNWLSLSPTTGTLLGSTETQRLQVTAAPAGLAPGVYIGTLSVSFSTNIVQDVSIALVVTSGTTTSGAKGAPALAACTPARMVMVETQLVQNFRTVVGWPTALNAQLVNDCGEKVTDATVLATFSTGDSTLLMQNLRNGNYSATWVPASQASQVTITMNAVHQALGQASVRLSGSLSSADTPVLFPNGAVNAASFRQFAPLPVGSIFSVFGRNLERNAASASAVPLPQQIGDVSVKLGTVDLPLFYAGPGQVNAQVPFDMPTGTTASLVVKRGNLFTAPEIVTIVPAQPAIFTLNQSGSGQGIITDAQYRVVDQANAAAAGSVVIIFATGLGATTPPVATGAAAPADPLSRVTTPVTVTIGGVDARVEFAGLAPGFVGLYQVNVRVPAGVAAGNAVPVVITQAGVPSNTVTMAVR